MARHGNPGHSRSLGRFSCRRMVSISSMTSPSRSVIDGVWNSIVALSRLEAATRHSSGRVQRLQRHLARSLGGEIGAKSSFILDEHGSVLPAVPLVPGTAILGICAESLLVSKNFRRYCGQVA